MTSRRDSPGHVECGLRIVGGLASTIDDGVTHGKHASQRERRADERRRSAHALWEICEIAEIVSGSAMPAPTAPWRTTAPRRPSAIGFAVGRAR